MTNEEAIELLYDIQTDAVYNVLSSEKEALDMAIKALEQQPCEDCISREQAIKQCGFGMTSLLIADCLRKLPSVTPTRPTAQWERVMDYNKCSNCGKLTKFYLKYNYCPNCGARMGESEKEI